MKSSLVLMSFAVLLLAGCSTVKVVPEKVDGGVINASENSQAINSRGVEITTRLDEVGINAYNLENTVTAFYVAIKNGTDSEVAFGDDSYLLVDESGLQYSLLTPEQVRDMLKRDSYYLVPYPYVGYYYLEDYEKTNAYNRTNSDLPYYYELYPQDIYTKALKPSTIIPGMKVEGLTYFKIDLAEHKSIKMLVYRKGASKSSPPDFTFPFKIIK